MSASMPEWNYDLTACPMRTDVLLLWAQRLLDGDDLPTGDIVGWSHELGERCGDDINDNLSWRSPSIDQFPCADFWGDDWEYAMAPSAWMRLPPTPPVPEREEDDAF